MSVAKKAVALKNFFPFYMVRGLMIFIQSEIFGNRRTKLKIHRYTFENVGKQAEKKAIYSQIIRHGRDSPSSEGWTIC